MSSNNMDVDNFDELLRREVGATVYFDSYIGTLEYTEICPLGSYKNYPLYGKRCLTKGHRKEKLFIPDRKVQEADINKLIKEEAERLARVKQMEEAKKLNEKFLLNKKFAENARRLAESQGRTSSTIPQPTYVQSRSSSLDTNLPSSRVSLNAQVPPPINLRQEPVSNDNSSTRQIPQLVEESEDEREEGECTACGRSDCFDSDCEGDDNEEERNLDSPVGSETGTHFTSITNACLSRQQLENVQSAIAKEWIQQCLDSSTAALGNPIRRTGSVASSFCRAFANKANVTEKK